MRTRIIVLLLVGVTLAAPASASAHARATTVALDYRLELDRVSRTLPGVTVKILDGDRALRVGAHGVTVVVRAWADAPAGAASVKPTSSNTMMRVLIHSSIRGCGRARFGRPAELNRV